MQLSKALRYVAAAAAFGVVGAVAISAGGEAQSQSNNVHDGVAGFVVHGFGYGLAQGQVDCPNGRSLGYRQIYEQSAEGQRREGESDGDYGRRLAMGEQQIARVDGQMICAHPELREDPHYKIMTSRNVVAYGIDLDGQDSRRTGRAAANTCAHDDFNGVNGARGVDNQLLRVMGCDNNLSYVDRDTTSDLPNGTAQSEYMRQGAWGILIRVSGIDDVRNDDDVRVGFYASNDPLQLNGETAIPNVTYAAKQDPRYRAETRGRIRNGVLTTEPVDVRFDWTVVGWHMDRELRHARVRMTFTADGGLEGYLAGYAPVENMYDNNYGFRSARLENGDPVPSAQSAGLAVPGNTVLGRTCNGAYHAMLAMADGDPDENGRCTSISTQLWIRAAPAFVVDAETRSINAQ